MACSAVRQAVCSPVLPAHTAIKTTGCAPCRHAEPMGGAPAHAAAHACAWLQLRTSPSPEQPSPAEEQSSLCLAGHRAGPTPAAKGSRLARQCTQCQGSIDDADGAEPSSKLAFCLTLQYMVLMTRLAMCAVASIRHVVWACNTVGTEASSRGHFGGKVNHFGVQGELKQQEW